MRPAERLTRAIRQQEQSQGLPETGREPARARIPILAMTANAMRGDREDCLASGMDDYLSKPFGQAQLLEVLKRWLPADAWSVEQPDFEPVTTEASEPSTDRADTGPRATERLPEEPEAARILLADDSDLSRQAVSGMLDHLGYQVELAANGREAMELASSQTYSMILMDCQMPGMDGYQAAQAIRELEAAGQLSDRTAGADSEPAQLPIVAVTGMTSAANAELVLASGMDDVLAKPFGLAELEQCLARWLPGQPVTEDNQVRSQPEPVCDDTLELGALDEIRAVEAGGSRGLLDRMIQGYLRSLPRLLATLGDAIDQGDEVAMRVSAHTLKSSSASLGAKRLASLFERLEIMARKQSVAGADELLAAVEPELDKVKKALWRQRKSPEIRGAAPVGKASELESRRQASV